MPDFAPVPAPYNAALVLADGTVFYGHKVGNEGTTIGEVCFNTALTGYQEVLTDPSYAGQIITFTFPHIGNVGTNDEDKEANQVFAKGLILREAISSPSNFRSEVDFNEWLKEHGLIGISGIDTRALTRHIRHEGAQNCAIVTAQIAAEIDVKLVFEQLQDAPSMEGREIAREVSTPSAYSWGQTRWTLGKGYGTLENPKFHVVAIDYGEKLNILRSLASVGCEVTVVPADMPAADILAKNPDGIFLSNGPGDPSATGEYAVPVIRELVESGVPIFGICLGHQLLALALGAKTEKMHQGHRGANQPVRNIATGQIEITSQNHGFVVCHGSLPEGVEMSHVSLFDGTCEGLSVKNKPIFSVQHHPESSPGPHDSHYLFHEFVDLMVEYQSKKDAA